MNNFPALIICNIFYVRVLSMLDIEETTPNDSKDKNHNLQNDNEDFKGKFYKVCLYIFIK